MASQIRFKFRSAKDFDVLYFDGVSLPLQDLKRRIIEKKGLATSGVDLIITNPENLGACLPPPRFGASACWCPPCLA